MRWITGAIVIGAALGYFAWRRPAPIVPPVHPAQRMGTEEAHTFGLKLGREGRHLESLPYFRSATARAPQSWSARENLANALFNGAQEARVHLGKDEPAIRSSVERVGMMEEFMLQSRGAEALAVRPRDRAVVVYQRAQALHTFGLIADAQVELRRAGGLDPSSPGIARATSRSEARLRTGGLAP